MEEEHSPNSSNHKSEKKEEFMANQQPMRTMGDFCRWTNACNIYMGFQLANPIDFDIKNTILSGLRDNKFDGSAILDLWEHMACFYETFSMCKPYGLTESQIKMRLFGF